MAPRLTRAADSETGERERPGVGQLVPVPAPWPIQPPGRPLARWIVVLARMAGRLRRATMAAVKREPLSVLVVDDQIHFPRAARAMLELTGEFAVAGQASSVAELLQLLDAVSVDVVLMDVNMTPVNGIDGARLVLERSNPPAVVLCSTVTRDRLPPIPDDLPVPFLYKGDLDPETLMTAWRHIRNERA